MAEVKQRETFQPSSERQARPGHGSEMGDIYRQMEADYNKNRTEQGDGPATDAAMEAIVSTQPTDVSVEQMQAGMESPESRIVDEGPVSTEDLDASVPVSEAQSQEAVPSAFDEHFDGEGKNLFESNGGQLDGVDIQEADINNTEQQPTQTQEKEAPVKPPTAADFTLARIASGEYNMQYTRGTEGRVTGAELVDLEGNVVGQLPREIGQSALNKALAEGEAAKAGVEDPKTLQPAFIKARLASGELELVSNTKSVDENGKERVTSLKVVDKDGNTLMEPTNAEIGQYDMSKANAEGRAKYPVESEKEEVPDVEGGVDVEPTAQVEQSAESSKAERSDNVMMGQINPETGQAEMMTPEEFVAKNAENSETSDQPQAESEPANTVEDGEVAVESEEKAEAEESPEAAVEVQEQLKNFENMSIAELQEFIDKETKLVAALKEFQGVIENANVAQEFKDNMSEMLNNIIVEREAAIAEAQKTLQEKENNTEQREQINAFMESLLTQMMESMSEEGLSAQEKKERQSIFIELIKILLGAGAFQNAQKA